MDKVVQHDPEDPEMEGLQPDAERRYWIRQEEAEGNVVGPEEGLGQIEMEVKISSPMSHNTLTSAEE